MRFTRLGPLDEGGIELALWSFKIAAGFPSPAAQQMDKVISLGQVLNSIETVNGHVVVALLNNDPT